MASVRRISQKINPKVRLYLIFLSRVSLDCDIYSIRETNQLKHTRFWDASGEWKANATVFGELELRPNQNPFFSILLLNATDKNQCYRNPGKENSISGCRSCDETFLNIMVTFGCSLRHGHDLQKGQALPFNKLTSVFLCVCPVIDYSCGSTRRSRVDPQTTLTMLWRNSWSITGQTH